MEPLTAQQVSKLIRLLVARTHDGTIKWRQPSVGIVECRIGSFEYSMESVDGDQVPPIELTIWFYGNDGPIELQRVSTHPSVNRPIRRSERIPDEDRLALMDLYEAALRKTNNFDEIVEEMFKSLGEDTDS